MEEIIKILLLMIILNYFFIIIYINYKKSEEKVKQIWSLYSFPKNSENVLYLFKKKEKAKMHFFLKSMEL